LENVTSVVSILTVTTAPKKYIPTYSIHYKFNMRINFILYK